MHRYVLAALIIFFTYFYISITVDLNEWSNNFKQSGFFIRGIKPGRSTAEYIQHRLIRITFVGATSLAFIAIIPDLLGELLKINNMVAQIILGGVGLLIVVGVSLDIIQKISSFLLAHQYQGLMGTKQAGPGAGLIGGRPNPAGKRF